MIKLIGKALITFYPQLIGIMNLMFVRPLMCVGIGFALLLKIVLIYIYPKNRPAIIQNLEIVNLNGILNKRYTPTRSTEQ